MSFDANDSGELDFGEFVGFLVLLKDRMDHRHTKRAALMQILGKAKQTAHHYVKVAKSFNAHLGAQVAPEPQASDPEPPVASKPKGGSTIAPELDDTREGDLELQDLGAERKQQQQQQEQQDKT